MHGQSNCARRVTNPIEDSLSGGAIVSLCERRAYVREDSAAVTQLIDAEGAANDTHPPRSFVMRAADGTIAFVSLFFLAALWPLARLAGVFSTTSFDEQD